MSELTIISTKRKRKSLGIKIPAKKPKGRSKLIKEADIAYSLHVRQKYADKDGIVGCYTCPYKNHWKKMQCGHYISRFFKYTRWDLDNLRPQCFMCNMRLGGCAHIFREKLVKELGEAHIKAMEERAKVLFREPDEWIEQKLRELV